MRNVARGIAIALALALAACGGALFAILGGDDPFILDESTIKIAFGVTADGDISIGVNGSLSSELNQTLILTLAPT